MSPGEPVRTVVLAGPIGFDLVRAKARADAVVTSVREGVESGEIWKPYMVEDRNLVTGQNPASAAVLAKRLLEVLASRRPGARRLAISTFTGVIAQSVIAVPQPLGLATNDRRGSVLAVVKYLPP